MIVVVPMAGGDEAFKERGYSYCKSLAEIQGKPLIEHVWERLRTLGADKHVFVVRRQDVRRFHLDDVLRLMVPDCKVIEAEGPTAGAACTVLLATEHIEADKELVIANGDQLITCDLGQIIADFRERKLDAGTIVFDSLHPRWSFVRLGDDALVVEAAEKRPISRLATAGFYYFRRGSDFITAAMAMIRKEAQVEGMYYVCPAFNELILRQARVGVHEIARTSYYSLASPQNVEEYEHLIAGRREREHHA